jgi:hypothetical protein
VILKTTALRKQQLIRLAMRTDRTLTSILEAGIDLFERHLDGELVEKAKK